MLPDVSTLPSYSTIACSMPYSGLKRRLEGIDAEDCPVKPFASQELSLRIEALLRCAAPDRRPDGNAAEHLHCDGLEIDTKNGPVAEQFEIMACEVSEDALGFFSGDERSAHAPRCRPRCRPIGRRPCCKRALRRPPVCDTIVWLAA